MMLHIALVTRLKKLEKETGIDRTEAALRSGLDASTINKIIAKDVNVKIRTLNQICKGFGITLKEFFNDDIFKFTWTP